MLNLIYNDPTGQERSVEIGPQNNRVLVGRSLECSIQTNNNSVSRVHALIFFNNGHVFIQDPPNGRPTNGTMVNKTRLQPGEVREFFAGDEIVCGNFLIRVEPSAAAPSVQGAFVPQQPAEQAYSNYNQQPAQAQQQDPYRYNQQQTARMPRPAAAADYNQQPAPASSNTYGQPTQRFQQDPYQQPQNNFQPQPAASGPSNEAYEQLKAECDMLKAELDASRGELDALRSQSSARDLELKELRENIDERERKLVDYEVQVEHHDTVVDSLNSTIKNLKDQLDYQKSQFHQCKDELDAAKGEVDDLNVELNSLRDQLESKGASSSNDKSIISELNRQLNAKSRAIDSNEKQIEELHYALDQERANSEQLEVDLETANGRLEGAERKLRDMKKVVEQHETLISDLNLKISERERDIHNLQDQLRAKGGRDSNALLEDLEKARAEISTKDREIASVKDRLRAAEHAAEDAAEVDELRERLKEAEARIHSHSNDAELDKLREENRKLHDQLDNGAAQDSSDLQRRIDELEAECDDLRNGSSASGLSDEDREQASSTFDAIYDSLKQVHEDSNELFENLKNLQKLYKAYYKIKLDSLPPDDKARVDKALSSWDPRIIFDAMAKLINKNADTSDEIKGYLREMKNLFC